MRFLSPLFILLVGPAVAVPLTDRQEDGLDCYNLCFNWPLPCPSDRIAQQIDSCWTCCLL
ncbi:hypothetical protein V8C42DRAFT_323225 [Trichoderma barbatum]